MSKEKKTRKEKREKLEERGKSVIECCINLPFQITRLRFLSYESKVVGDVEKGGKGKGEKRMTTQITHSTCFLIELPP
jgi:hypothetical protein